MLLTFAKNPFSKFNVSISQNILLKDGRRSNKMQIKISQESEKSSSLQLESMRRPTAIFESPLYLETSVPFHYLDLNFLFSDADSDTPLHVPETIQQLYRTYLGPSLYNWNPLFIHTHKRRQNFQHRSEKVFSFS